MKFRCNVAEMRRAASFVVAVGLGLCVAFGCGDRESATRKATYQECANAAEHIAALMIAEETAKPDELWERMHAGDGDSGIPEHVTKEGFASWLASPEGKTWSMQAHGHVLSGTQRGIESCTKKATKQDIDCLIKTTSKSEVDACDQAALARERAAGEQK